MLKRIAPAGEVGQFLNPERDSAIVATDPADRVWDGYLADPDEQMLGVCTSGGGIRSASFSLGALQVLADEGRLAQARHLACVSGGGYISIAHAIMASETIRRGTDAARKADPCDNRTPSEIADSVEDSMFGRHRPWAPGSPEEQHLRQHLKYVAPGLVGRVWMLANLLYGM